MNEHPKLHTYTARFARRPTDGMPSWGFGIRFGYWPCVHAPYLQLAFLFWRVSVWYGLKGNKNTKELEAKELA